MMTQTVHLDAFMCELSLQLGPSSHPISTEVEQRRKLTICINNNWLTVYLVYTIQVNYMKI